MIPPVPVKNQAKFAPPPKQSGTCAQKNLSLNPPRPMFRSLKLQFHVLLLIAFGMAQAGPSRGTVVFSTLSVEGNYDTTTAYAINGSASGFGYQAHANRFLPSGSGMVSSIELGLHYGRSDPSPSDVFDVKLVLDRIDPAYGNLPSSTNLVSGTVTATSQFSASGLLTFVPSQSALLQTGTAYWLVVMPHFTTTLGDWNLNSIGATGGIAASFDGATWGQNPSGVLNAFRVNADPLPEPGAGGLALTAAATLGLWRRRGVRNLAVIGQSRRAKERTTLLCEFLHAGHTTRTTEL